MPVGQRATLKRLGGRRENDDCLKNSQFLLSKIVVCCILRRKRIILFHFFIALTDIQFHRTQPIPKMFELKFHKNDTWYAVHASESGVTASTVSQIYVLIILYLIVFVILSEFH